YIICIGINEPKTNTPLIVYGNGILSFSISLQIVEPVTGRNPQVIQAGRQIKVFQFPHSPLPYLRRKTIRFACIVQFLRVPIGKRLNHD
ncbi:MAG: hypothetical protein A2Y97_11760, partial [Nitrospirae bacterium RBG_13_39_12]